MIGYAHLLSHAGYIEVVSEAGEPCYLDGAPLTLMTLLAEAATSGIRTTKGEACSSSYTTAISSTSRAR